MFYKIRPPVKNGGLCGSHEPLDPYPSQDGSPAVLTAYLRRPFDVYPLALVMTSLKTYMLRHSDFPAPADIVKIIDPQPEQWHPRQKAIT